MKFVLAYVEHYWIKGKILFVKRTKQDWQEGRYNLIGGKIEEGETPIEAVERELLEESGLTPFSIDVTDPPLKIPDANIQYGIIKGSWGIVYCFKVRTGMDQELKPFTGEVQPEWLYFDEVKDSNLLIPNLKVIIPLMKNDCKGWVIEDEGPSWGQDQHSIKITIPTGE